MIATVQAIAIVVCLIGLIIYVSACVNIAMRRLP